MSFGVRVKERLVQLGKTAAWLSTETGIGQPAISRYLKGERQPMAAQAKAIASALGVSVEDLVGEPASPVRREVVYEDRYPSRAAAIALVGDTVESQVISAVRHEAFKHDGDPGLDFWLARIRELEQIRKRFQQSRLVVDTEVEPEDGDRMPPGTE